MGLESLGWVRVSVRVSFRARVSVTAVFNQFENENVAERPEYVLGSGSGPGLKVNKVKVKSTGGV